MAQPVKMKDIADVVGVSVSTVARALAGSSRIGLETRTRIAEAAERLGYVVDQAARTMRKGASDVVGLLVPDIQNEFYSTAAKAIADCCRERGMQLMLSVTNDDGDLELHHLKSLRAAKALGVIIIPSIAPKAETLQMMRSMPHVQFVRHSTKVRSDWFGIEDAEAMRLAASHVLELGHRHIAYIGSTVAISTGRDRLRGFRETLEAAGVTVNEALIRTGSCEADFGYAAMDSLLGEKRPPTAVITAGARMSLGAYECARDRGVDIPGALSFVGFSDAPAFRWCGTGLTTIALPVRDLAIATTDHMFRQAQDKRGATKAQFKLTLGASLIVRGSTAPLAQTPPVKYLRAVPPVDAR